MTDIQYENPILSPSTDNKNILINSLSVERFNKIVKNNKQLLKTTINNSPYSIKSKKRTIPANKILKYNRDELPIQYIFELQNNEFCVYDVQTNSIFFPHPDKVIKKLQPVFIRNSKIPYKELQSLIFK